MRRNVANSSRVSKCAGSGWSHASRVDETSRRQAGFGLRGSREVPGAGPAVAGPGEDGYDVRAVAGASTLDRQPAAGAHHREQIAEQRLVVGDPVERRGGEHGVDRFGHGERQLEVGFDDGDARAVLRKVLAGLRQHRRRRVDRDHAAVGHAVEQGRGNPAAAGARVEDRLVAAKPEAVDDRSRPAELRRGSTRCRSPRPSRGASLSSASASDATGVVKLRPPTWSGCSTGPMERAVLTTRQDTQECTTAADAQVRGDAAGSVRDLPAELAVRNAQEPLSARSASDAVAAYPGTSRATCLPSTTGAPATSRSQ